LIRIDIVDGESLDKVFRKFKRRVEQAAILKDLKKREFYLKPSMKKKLKNRTVNGKTKKREKRLTKKIFS